MSWTTSLVPRNSCSRQACRAWRLEFSSEVKGSLEGLPRSRKLARCLLSASFLPIFMVSCQHCLWGWDCALHSRQVERQSQVENPGLLTYMTQPRAEPWTRFWKRCHRQGNRCHWKTTPNEDFQVTMEYKLGACKPQGYRVNQ